MNQSLSHLPHPEDSEVVMAENVQTIDVSPQFGGSGQSSQLAPRSAAGSLTTTGNNFASFLAPLTPDRFREVVSEVENKLRIVNQTLSLLDMQGFDAILDEMLASITEKTRELLNADRATIYLLDETKNELYTSVTGANGRQREIRIPADQGIAGEVAQSRRPVNIPFDFFDDPRSHQAKQQFEKTGYRTYTMLTLPLLGEEGDLVAVIQLINKLKVVDPSSELSRTPENLGDRIDYAGFTSGDEILFREFTPCIRLILESSRSFDIAAQRQRAAHALMMATQSLSQSRLDLGETLNRVMNEAKQLMNADRSTLWLIDEDAGEIWTRIPVANGSQKEMRIPIGTGFAGQVALTGETINISFDLYDQAGAETAKRTDQDTGYRTCSLLCMPVHNPEGELIGVTQLVNKRKQGDYPPYDPLDWPQAPDCWQASFNSNDQEFMQTFNIQAGVALQNAKLFETIKQQEQLQRDILRSLSNGVISTDPNGQIISANESAKRLLGCDETALLEGEAVTNLIRIERANFRRWINMALNPRSEKDRQQYYPDQTLMPHQGEEQHSVNLAINTIAAPDDPAHILGVLVVMDDISDAKRLKSTMYRYMTQELAEQLLENPDAAKMGGDRKEVSVLFSDIRSYTTLTETLAAEEVVEMLNEYFEVMVDAVFAHKGILDKYIGDAIMAVFGSPLPLDDHPWMAVQTAISMRHRLVEFNQKRALNSQAPIKIGIGINSDSVISGNIGSSKRMEFTAIGDGVNLGSRLESTSKLYGTDIVISDSTYKPCADRVWARELDFIKVKGKNRPVAIYELVGLKSEPLSDHKHNIIEQYQDARQLYLKRRFADALGLFGKVLEIEPSDQASSLHIDRCRHWLTNPPPDNWDGAWALTEK